MRNHILLYINQQRIEARDNHAFMSLSDFIRLHLRQTGTKVVCAEGDCGSCTVLLGRIVDKQIRYEPVCSCIQYLYQLDGTHVINVEGLTYDAELNPVQQSMVACQGAQCGYCTPGFVVAMHQLFEDGQSRNEAAVKRALTGNLCRCTGYDPILKAARETDMSKMRRIAELFPIEKISSELSAAANDPVQINYAGKTFFKPTVISDACRFRAGHPDCTLITGGTDIGVQVNKGIRQITAVMNLHGVSQRSIEIKNDYLLAGAGATLTELFRACEEYFPEFANLLDIFGSPLIRNAGTLAGNLANGSPIGDTLPPLFVMNAEIELTGINGSRWVNINSFYVGYRKTIMGEDELITAIKIPLPKPDEIVKFYKVSRRRDLDISTFAAAIFLRLSGKLIHEIRIALGGVGPVVLRLSKTESALTNQLFTEDAMLEASNLALSEITPITDVRGSANYRNRLAANTLLRFYHDITGQPSNGNGHPKSPPDHGDNGRDSSSFILQASSLISNPHPTPPPEYKGREGEGDGRDGHSSSSNIQRSALSSNPPSEQKESE
ncbi:MAG TPA: FAD binding domain-containing protein [Tepidisphaeraceae bacterium]|jgi:xanthine dehydrogenase small subunit